MLSAYADGPVTFTTNAPMLVTEGETFRVEFELNANPDDDSFSAPAFNGFDVLGGPAISKGSSVQIINGSMTKNVSYTYGYVLHAPKAGNFTFGSASVTVDSKRYKTKPLPIEVVSQSEKNNQQGNQNNSGASSQASSSRNQNIAEDDLFLRTIVSRGSVFKGEPLRATIKLYSRVSIVGSENAKLPSFNGFWAQSIMKEKSEVSRETYNGKVYETHILNDYILYPQQSGKLTIDPAELTIVAQIAVQSRNPDPFFGGREIYNVRRNLSTPKITIDVKSLPAGAPDSFNGAVGNFSMEGSISPQEVVANSSLTYNIRISGSGNLSFVQAPTVTLPTSFEQYNTKTTESINTTLAGATGYKQFEYPIIPRSEGEYTIRPVEFSYFNPKTISYETLRTDQYIINIVPDANGSSSNSDEARIVRGLSKEEVKMLGQDIRFIKIDSADLVKESKPFIFSTTYFILLFGIIVIFAGLYILLRRLIRESKNSALTRGKRANKIAIQRFKAAKTYMNEQDEKAFYKETLRALWGYMSDKFNIPVANLTKESVREELQKRGVPNERLSRFSQIVTQCDEAQYSPMASSQMNEVYVAALELISKIETDIKK